MRRIIFFFAVLVFSVLPVFANSAPVVRYVTVSQRTDGSQLVDIRYNLYDADGDKCTVSVQVSSDGGGTWTVPAVSFTGAIGSNISPGTGKLIVWDCGKDLPGEYGINYRVKVIADDGAGSGMVWVYINDPGVAGHEGFTGYMSKYETTNAQYCQFLNAALASGDIYVSGNRVYGSNGTNSGTDYVGHVYFYTYAYTIYSQITYSGGVFSVRSRDGYSMANHPVVEVSWYGAMAFAGYYGWRLPTEWEWQAVADYDGSFTYGCGTTINQSKANYYDNGFANPLGLSSYPYTSPVGYYPAYGYGMCDMAGNVWEWTDSCYYSDCDLNYRVLRGGGWNGGDYYCEVSSRSYLSRPYFTDYSHGFRVCR